MKIIQTKNAGGGVPCAEDIVSADSKAADWEPVMEYSSPVSQRPGGNDGVRMKQYGVPVVAISGAKNAGKTTLIEGLLAQLTARGLRVAVFKHDAHCFSPDVPGTDSYRHRAAGASGVAVYSDDCYMMMKNENIEISKLVESFLDMDLILIEGMKSSRFPKIEVMREGNSKTPVCDSSTIIALATDMPIHIAGKPSYPLDDYEGLTGFLQYAITIDGMSVD